MTKSKAWWQFTKERFEPWSHMTMIFVFLLAHLLVVNSVKMITIFSLQNFILLVGVTAFYFKLRLYDEVKDFDLDVIINKSRPLPRGLLNHRDMYRGMITCILIELASFSLMGLQSFITLSIAILYSLLMYKEFFIAEKIRPHLTTYALTHTIVTTFLSFAIFSFLTQLSFIDVIKNPYFVSFALANWLLFNLFEFGRKTFATEEERPNVDTYSSLFGKLGAASLVASQAIIAHALALGLDDLNQAIVYWGFGILIVTLAIVSINFIISNTRAAAKRFRSFSSIYIVVFYLILIFSYLIT